MTTVDTKHLTRVTLKYLRASDKVMLIMEPVMGFMFEVFFTVVEIVLSVLLSMLHFFISPHKKSVKGEVVLITGGARGVGALMAREFARRGAVTVIWDLDEDALRALVEDIQSNKGIAHGYICDVSSCAEIYQVGKRVQDEVGDVDILINNTAMISGNTFLQSSDEDVVKMFNINLLAYIWAIKCFLPKMVERNHGHIVNISTSAGIVGVSGMADYSATKFGLVGLTETLCYELRFSGKDKVYTTVVCPHYIASGMFEGCRARFPWILPVLNPKKTADRIVKAVLSNQKMLCIPRRIYILAHLKTFLPVDAQKIVHRFSGASTFLPSFIRREKKS